MVYLQSHDQVICGNLSRDVRVPDGRQPKERALHRQVHRLLPVPVRAQRGLGMILILNYNKDLHFIDFFIYICNIPFLK